MSDKIKGRAWEGLLVLILLAGAWVVSAGWLERVGTMTGLLCVLLTVRRSIWCWPFGIVNVVCFAFLFYEARLYADMSLQGAFLILSIQGWIYWLSKPEENGVRATRRLTKSQAIWLGAALVLVTMGWGYGLERYTEASIPYADAFIAGLSLLAQVLLSGKVLENWLLWIAVDVLSIGMYAYKELYAVAILYGVYLALAAAGWIQWKREFAAKEAAEAGQSQRAAGAAIDGRVSL